MEVNKVAEEWEIWDEKEEVEKSEEETKKIGISKVLQVDLCLWKESK